MFSILNKFTVGHKLTNYDIIDLILRAIVHLKCVKQGTSS